MAIVSFWVRDWFGGPAGSSQQRLEEPQAPHREARKPLGRTSKTKETSGATPGNQKHTRKTRAARRQLLAGVCNLPATTRKPRRNDNNNDDSYNGDNGFNGNSNNGHIDAPLAADSNATRSTSKNTTIAKWP